MIEDEVAILGFDILPMSSTNRHEGVRVAASAIFEDGSTKEYSEISRDKLLKVINKYNFKFVGTDNPSEIIEQGESLASFCRRLPSNTSFVHVNLTRSGNTVSLQSLLYQYNIVKNGQKLSAVKTARAIVNLIKKGVGMILEPFESETLVKVGKPSSSSKGGWSQSRYQRQAEEVVGREAGKIESILDREKIPYDKIIHSTKYGAKMARFHIFKPRHVVDNAFTDISFYPAKVKIWSPKKKVITHRPVDISRKPHRAQFYSHLQRLIVGLDPGMTTGVAISNLNGKVLTVFSRKNLSKGQLVSEIANYGIPVLVCADVSPVPTFVSKFAATYNAEMFAPSIQLSKSDKRFLANKTDITRHLDSHERDALAAIQRAYQTYKDNFDRINQTELNRKQKDLAKGMLIRGLSVNDSIESVKLIEDEKYIQDEEIEELSEPDEQLLQRVGNLLKELALSEEIISNLRAHTGRLEAKNQLLESKTNTLKNELSSIREEKMREVINSEVIQEKERQIKVLRRRLDEKKRKLEQNTKKNKDLEEMLWVSLNQEGHSVKILPKFSHDAIDELREKSGINDGDIILILDPTGGGPQTATNLVKNKLQFIFIEGNNLPKPASEIFYNEEIPVLRSEKYSIIRSDFLGVINSQNLLKAKEDYNEKIEKRKEREKTEQIFKTIENYKYERSKELEESFKSYDDYEPEEDEIANE